MKTHRENVLLDNTTVYGAYHAYRSWPPSSNSWLEEPNALNLRSLMDILEAIVLYDRLIIDASSRVVPGDRNTFERVWDDFMFLQDETHSRLVSDVAFAYISGGRLVQFAVDIALDKLLDNLIRGTFRKAADQFSHSASGITVPEFYRSPQEFSSLFAKSFAAAKLPPETIGRLKRVEDVLKSISIRESNYAMFAFRGYYYHELARQLKMSYSPHTWRSHLIDADIEKPSPGFAQHAFRVTGQVRQGLVETLNTAYDTTSFGDRFPVIATFIVHQCNTRTELLRTALEVRRTPSVKAFREWISEMQLKIDTQSDLPSIARANSELEHIVRSIRKELRLIDEKRTEEVKIKVQIPAVSFEAPVRIPLSNLPSWLDDTVHRRSYLVFLREVTKQSVSLSPFAYRFAELRP